MKKEDKIWLALIWQATMTIAIPEKLGVIVTMLILILITAIIWSD